MGTYICVKQCNGPPILIFFYCTNSRGLLGIRTGLLVFSPLDGITSFPLYAISFTSQSADNAGCSLVATWPSQGRLIDD